jgi:lipid-binding SYLF domain-containing protein
MLFMNDRVLHSLLSDKFKLGADASVAAGPVGRTAAAGTDIAPSDKSLTKSANGRMATEAAWFKSKIPVRKREKPKPP